MGGSPPANWILDAIRFWVRGGRQSVSGPTNWAISWAGMESDCVGAQTGSDLMLLVPQPMKCYFSLPALLYIR